MIEIKGVKKSFGENHILKGVDLDIKDGEVIVILGPSGSGKTTFLRCISFLEKADEGKWIVSQHRRCFVQRQCDRGCHWKSGQADVSGQESQEYGRYGG